MNPESSPDSFEQAMARLEEIVRLLESGELPLDETVRLYEEGQKLRRFCEQKLNDAEQRIKIVSYDEDGDVHIEELDPDSL
ncbi:MAG: exodeoxyribonuclease VII small subunit [Fimbriimonadales bacterium]